MKKLILLMAAGLIATGVSAQTSRGVKTTELTSPVFKANSDATPMSQSKGANKTTVGGSRSYNAAEALGAYASLPASGAGSIYSTDLMTWTYLWQDSSVRYPAPDNAFGITYLSIAQVFHPQSSLYNSTATAANNGKIAITNNKAFNLDSISIMGRYERVSAATVVDTLIFSIVMETPAKKFSDMWFIGGNAKANHNIDTMPVLYYLSADYLVKPPTARAYGNNNVFLDDTIFKVPLTAAKWADSTADGWNIITAKTNLARFAGSKLAVSISYKSGAPYTAGSPITNYNRFGFVAHETDIDAFVWHPEDDKNVTYVATKDTTDDVSGVNNVFVMYYPTIGFTNGTYGLEVANISFHTTCPTCFTTGIENVANGITSATAYPNPANNEVSIPVTVGTAASVEVSLLNTLGQTVSVSNLGKLNAGQTATAIFNTGSLPAGLYMYSVNANGQRSTGKVVVAH